MEFFVKLFLLPCLMINRNGFAESVRCLTCENAISNEDCIARGRLVECFGEGIGCSSEVRYHAGFVSKIQIKKGCKQILACGSDKSQNGHGWYPVQCNPKFPDSICRCCCQTDDCNRNLIGCEPPQPECKKLILPEHGSKLCNNEEHPTALRSICTFICDKGYELRGDYRTECHLSQSGKAVWSTKEPKCVPKKCKPVYYDTAERRVSCTAKNNAGSVCTFKCVRGHVMNGEPQSTCLLSKNWDYPPPDCVRITCPPPINPPAYSEMECTDGNEYGSVCEYFCLPGYQVVGNSTRQCVLGKSDGTAFGQWSGALPQCVAIMCEPKLTNPQFGQFECTDMNYIGSTCTFVCREGHKLVGTETSTCVVNKETGAAEWTSNSPVCERIVCEEIVLQDSNGYVSCSNGNNIGSMCAFACNEGAYIKGISKRKRVLQSLVLNCQEDGTWSEELTECSKIVCYPDYSSMTIANGGLLCTDGNSYKSECTYFCDDGYDLKGPRRSLCKDGNSIEAPGVWTTEGLPKCIRTGCGRVPTTDNKMRVSCTKKYLFGSVCSFSCKTGYYMTTEQSKYVEENEYSIECKTDKFWTAKPPVCKPIRCLPAMGRLSNGDMRCSNGNNYNSRCTFRCDVAYDLDGPDTSYCTDDVVVKGIGQWTSPQPSCIRVGCAPKYTTPNGGRMTCTNKNLFHSACTFSCKNGYYMASHDNYLIEENVIVSKCSPKGDWSEIPPTCHKITCKPLDLVLENGNITCSDGNNWRSKCRYTCNVGYEVDSKSDISECTDKLTSSAYGRWSRPDIECKRATCTVRQRAPPEGKVACSAGNGVGSECVFACYEGHYLASKDGKYIGSRELRMKCQGDKTWSGDAPRCLPVTCPKSDIESGSVQCTNENSFMSKCKFDCSPGFTLIGSDSSICRNDRNHDDVGVWVKPWPSCTELGCDPKFITMPKNGFILCSDGARLGSTCEFMCDPGYQLTGSQFTVCKAGPGSEIKWDKRRPTCIEEIK